MAEQKQLPILIAAPQNVAEKLERILATTDIEKAGVYHTGGEALEALAESEALLLTTYKLSDMTGAQLAEQAGEQVYILMIVPQDFSETLPENVLPLYNPISQDALVQAIRAAMHGAMRIRALRAQVAKLTRTLEDRKIIERAKGRLMDEMKLSESEAHYRMQKKSMDSGRRIVDVAREILESEATIIAC